jgi:predicted Rossmann-fold nucleotide-binding protein
VRLTIGVMGSSSGVADAAVEARLEQLGRAVAQQECTLITGACPGLPYAAVRGAKSAGGLVALRPG